MRDRLCVCVFVKTKNKPLGEMCGRESAQPVPVQRCVDMSCLCVF